MTTKTAPSTIELSCARDICLASKQIRELEKAGHHCEAQAARSKRNNLRAQMEYDGVKLSAKLEAIAEEGLLGIFERDYAHLL